MRWRVVPLSAGSLNPQPEAAHVVLDRKAISISLLVVIRT
jgi:hypothetical protein